MVWIRSERYTGLEFHVLVFLRNIGLISLQAQRATHSASIDKIHNYVILIRSESECISVLRILVKSPSWNPHGKFLVHVPRTQKDWQSLVTFIFKQFWKHYVINISINVPRTESSSDSTVAQVNYITSAIF